jgi:hypothetical protein
MFKKLPQLVAEKLDQATKELGTSREGDRGKEKSRWDKASISMQQARVVAESS